MALYFIMRRSILTIFLCLALTSSHAQQYTAYTSYTWDSWASNSWKYAYSNGWVYAIPYGGNPKDFYFRFNYGELGLRELEKKEWKSLKVKNGWLDNLKCTFEYYVTDEYPTIKDALAAHSWPCAKYYHSTSSGMPIVKRTAIAEVKAYYTDDDEVRTLNFWIEGYGFGITVKWDYSGSRMTYYL